MVFVITKGGLFFYGTIPKDEKNFATCEWIDKWVKDIRKAGEFDHEQSAKASAFKHGATVIEIKR